MEKKNQYIYVTINTHEFRQYKEDIAFIVAPVLIPLDFH